MAARATGRAAQAKAQAARGPGARQAPTGPACAVATSPLQWGQFGGAHNAGPQRWIPMVCPPGFSRSKPKAAARGTPGIGAPVVTKLV
jgi:hypothetical protein